MGKQSNRRLVVYLPLVFVATFLVVVVPLLLVFSLRRSGVVTSVWVGVVIGVVASFLVSYAGGAFWKTRTDSRDILFSELMIWGWVQRWRSERRLSAAADLLGLTTGRPQAISGGRLTGEQKAGLLTQLTSGLEARDAYTHGHSRRVARHSSNIAKRMGLSREEVAKIRAAGAMHDVGKVETPIRVLHKEGKLTDGEYAIIKRHPVDGAEMVSTLHDDELTAMVRHHHERMDGTGYPDRLAGEAIPIGARILAVADTFDAITSTRPYRHAHAHKKALDILGAGAGTQLDPDAVRAFGSCYSGRRPLAYWTILAHGRPRLASLLGGGLSTASAGTMANVMTTAAAAAAVGGIALGQLVKAPAESPRALVEAGKSPASSQTRSRPQASRRGDPPSPLDRPGSRRDRGPSPTRSATPVPASTTVPAQGSGDRRRPTAPHSIPANGSEPAATPLPANQPTQGNGEEKDKPRGGEKDAGHDDKGPTRDEDRDPDKTKGKAHGRDKGRGPDSGRGPDKGPRPDKDRGPDNGKGKDQGPAGNPTPGSSPGHGQGDGDSLGEPPHTRPKTQGQAQGQGVLRVTTKGDRQASPPEEAGGTRGSARAAG